MSKKSNRNRFNSFSYSNEAESIINNEKNSEDNTEQLSTENNNQTFISLESSDEDSSYDIINSNKSVQLTEKNTDDNMKSINTNIKELPDLVTKFNNDKINPASQSKPQLKPITPIKPEPETRPIKKSHEKILNEIMNKNTNSEKLTEKSTIKKSNNYQIIFCTNPSPLQFNKITNQLRKINEFYEVDNNDIKGRSFSTNDEAIAEKKRLAGKGLKPTIRIV